MNTDALLWPQIDEKFRLKAGALRFLNQDIGELRRGDHFAERMRLDPKDAAFVHSRVTPHSAVIVRGLVYLLR